MRFHAVKFILTVLILTGVQAAPAAGQVSSGTAPQAAVTIDLQNALERARENSQQLMSASIDVDLAREDKSQAKAALLPSAGYFNEYLYTQGNGTDSGIFVGNDGVHVYSSQLQVHQELFAPEKLAEYRRTTAAQSLAAARRDIVERGLVATVVQSYYAAVVAQRHITNSQSSLQEAGQFEAITEKLEQGGEVAHADVLKARLVLQQRQRELREAQLAGEKSRIELSVLLFPSFRLDFNIVDDLNTVSVLPPYASMEPLAGEKSPDLRAAAENVRQQEFGVSIARASYLPSLSFDYFFGINANQFAVHDPEGINRLGSSAQATLSIPVWDWWSNRSKVRQADMRRRQAELDLELSRKQLISNLHALYSEAQAALSQLDLLRNTLDDSVESLRLTNLRYEAGEVSVLEVVDAQSTLADARNAYDDGLLRYRQALSSLQILTGTM